MGVAAVFWNKGDDSNMLQQSAWTFRYSLEGFLKRLLHGREAGLGESELVEAVLSGYAAGDEKSLETIPARVRAALNAAHGAFVKTDDERVVLREPLTDELTEQCYRFLQSKGRPQKNGEILRHLQEVTGRGRGELMSRVDLDRDPRFVRLENGEWLLTEWELVNDAVAALMTELGQRRADRSDLLALLAEEEHWRGKTLIFYPENDPRFAVSGETVECLLVDQEAAERTKPIVDLSTESKEDSDMSETMMMDTVITEEKKESDAKDDALIDSVLAMLTQAIATLNERNQEIPNEVLTLFNLEDLQGIEKLMTQRKRLMALAEDLQALVAKWSSEHAE
jgi:hypothetical protein